MFQIQGVTRLLHYFSRIWCVFQQGRSKNVRSELLVLFLIITQGKLFIITIRMIIVCISLHHKYHMYLEISCKPCVFLMSFSEQIVLSLKFIILQNQIYIFMLDKILCQMYYFEGYFKRKSHLCDNLRIGFILIGE